MRLEGFARRTAKGVPYYASTALDELGFVRHGFSTRLGGVSMLPEGSLNLCHLSWDASERVEENRRRFMNALELQSSTIATLSQIHSDRVHIIRENAGQWNPRTEGDALVTRLEGVALAVQVADCFPILMVDASTRTIASVHSGWRGILSRILSKTAERMHQEFGSNPLDLRVAIGPGIRSCCFEVGPEVVESFNREYDGIHLVKRHPGHPGRYLLDLRCALEDQLQYAGVPSGNVADLGKCTRCNTEEFFSYRREGPGSGRMMGLIAIAHQ